MEENGACRLSSRILHLDGGVVGQVKGFVSLELSTTGKDLKLASPNNSNYSDGKFHGSIWINFCIGKKCSNMPGEDIVGRAGVGVF